MKLFRVTILMAWLISAALAGFAPAQSAAIEQEAPAEQNTAVEQDAAAEQDASQKVSLILSQMKSKELDVWDASLRLERLGPDASAAIQQQLDLPLGRCADSAESISVSRRSRVLLKKI